MSERPERLRPQFDASGERPLFAMDQDGNERHQLYLHSPGGVDVVPLTGTPEIKHIIGPWSPDTGAIALTDGLGSVDLG